MRVILTIAIDHRVKARLESVARSNDRSMSAEVRVAIEKHIADAAASKPSRKAIEIERQ